MSFLGENKKRRVFFFAGWGAQDIALNDWGYCSATRPRLNKGYDWLTGWLTGIRSVLIFFIFYFPFRILPFGGDSLLEAETRESWRHWGRVVPDRCFPSRCRLSCPLCYFLIYVGTIFTAWLRDKNYVFPCQPKCVTGHGESSRLEWADRADKTWGIARRAPPKCHDE